MPISLSESSIEVIDKKQELSSVKVEQCNVNAGIYFFKVLFLYFFRAACNILPQQARDKLLTTLQLILASIYMYLCDIRSNRVLNKMTLPEIETFLNADYQPLKDDFTPLYKDLTAECAYEFLDKITEIQFQSGQFDLSKTYYDNSTIRFFGSRYVGTVWDGILGAVKGMYLAQISDSNGKSVIFKLIYSYNYFSDTLKELLARLEKITGSIDMVLYIDRQASDSKFLEANEDYRIVCPIKKTEKAVKFMKAIFDADFNEIKLPENAPDNMIKKYENTLFAEIEAFPLDSKFFRAGIFWDKETDIRYGFFTTDRGSNLLSLGLGYPSRQSIENLFKEGKNGVKIDKVYNYKLIEIENIIFNKKLEKVQQSQLSLQKRLKRKESEKNTYDTKLSVWHEKKKDTLDSMENSLGELRRDLDVNEYIMNNDATETEQNSTEKKISRLNTQIEKKEAKILEFKLKFEEMLRKKQMKLGKRSEAVKILKEKNEAIDNELKKYVDKMTSGKGPPLYEFVNLGPTICNVGMKELVLNMTKEIVSMITDGNENWDILTVKDVLINHKGNIYSNDTTRIIKLNDFRLKKLHKGVEKFLAKLNSLEVKDIDGKLIQFSMNDRTPKRRVRKS